MFPVEEKIGEIRSTLSAGHDVVLTAPPGSGKTTCVPPALLDEPWLQGKKIVMLEPRRLAARNCAAYIAKKRGEAVGGTIGYQVRLERMISKSTRLEVVTEGLLTQRIMSDPELSDVGLVIFDEFHERSLQCDLAYALALEVKNALRPDLRIVVMSATLDADEVVDSLSTSTAGLQPARVIAQGRMFPVETKYLGEVPMSAAVAQAYRETDGDILCFLPGEGEIKRNLDSVLNLNLQPQPLVLPLYGSLSKEEQDKVFRPSDKRKIVLATSIAETSVTLEGVTAVVDSGLMRVPRFSPSTGMSGLVTLPLTQDRAEQRRGRAGRVRAGVCYRLWTEASEASRPKKMMPEILDADLCSLVLTSCAWGALRREDLPWMTPPPASAWDQSVGLLKLLGALDDRGNLTAKGKAMAKLPMHPRLANMFLATGEKHLGGEERIKNEELGIDEDKISLYAAIIEEGSRSRETDIRYVPVTPRIRQLAKRFSHHNTSLFALRSALQPSAALALAYPDRVAKNRGNGTFTMVSGRGAFLPDDDPLSREPYLVCCELDDRMGDAKIFLACPILESEIETLFADRIVEEPFCEWDRKSERVKAVVKRRLGAMTLGERPELKCEVEVEERMVRALIEGVRLKGVENLPCWTKETLQLRARINFLHRVLSEDDSLRCSTSDSNFNSSASWPQMSDDLILSALPGFVDGMTKWKDLEKLDIAAVMDFILSDNGHDRRELDRLAPVRMEVPSGSHMIIHYEGDEPTVEVRLQECFGLMETPKVSGGKVPIVMTLLSPAQRPCAVTKDLAGFWKEGYQLVRKDLRGRYPKHYWPEDPFSAVATRRVRPR